MFIDYVLRFILSGVTSEKIGVTSHSIDHRTPTYYRYLRALHMSPVDRAVSVTGMKLVSVYMATFNLLSEKKMAIEGKTLKEKKTNNRSVANVYFDARAVGEDEDIDENYSDYSDDSADDCTDGYSDCEFDYSASDKTERSKVEEFVKNTCEILV